MASKKAARKKALMEEIFEGPDSMMGRIFEGPNSVMGRIFGSSESIATAFEPVAPIIRIRLAGDKLIELVSGKPLEYCAGGQTVRLELEPIANVKEG